MTVWRAVRQALTLSKRKDSVVEKKQAFAERRNGETEKVCNEPAIRLSIAHIILAHCRRS